MKEQEAIDALKKLREVSRPRNFEQTVELMINFTGLDIKKPQNQISLKLELPHSTGKGSGKVCVFTKTDSFKKSLEGKVELIIPEKEIEKIAKNKKRLAELLTYDALFAEGSAMLTIAKFLGQELAPKGKMPKPVNNPKYFDEILAKAKTQVTISNKRGKVMPVIHTAIGKERMEDKKIAENIVTVYNKVMEALPQKKQNIKNAYVKMTMSAPVKIGETK